MALYAFDGTGKTDTLEDKDDKDKQHASNVARFRAAYNGKTLYEKGVGTMLGPLGKVAGLPFGAGGPERIGKAYKELCQNWKDGDHDIDIIGFSRGAALALDFANKIESSGIRRPDSKEVVEAKPSIRFLGLWDTVGSFGVPFNVALIESQKINFGHKLYIPDNVKYCFHAMSMDERRQTFRVTRVLNGYEVWFRGVHSDVGGGNGNEGLSNITLRWMFRKAVAAGLPIIAEKITDLEGKIDPNAETRPVKLDVIHNAYRGFLKGDRFHYTVQARPDHNNPPDNCLRETEAEELNAIPMANLQSREDAVAGLPMIGERLDVGQSTGERNVHARYCWNLIGIAVKKGEHYDISATGKWQDQGKDSTAAGYERLRLNLVKGTRRVSKSHWFCLIAAVHPSRVLEFEESNTTNLVTDLFVAAFDRDVKKIDSQSQLVAIGEQGSIEVDRDGYLYLFANDTPGFYANNKGEVQATIARKQ